MKKNIVRIFIVIFTIQLLLLPSAILSAAEQTEKQTDIEALQKQLEKEFVAPCCWNEAVATHQSGTSDEVKKEIRSLLNEGRSRQEIRAYMVSKYSERILITPEAKGFNLIVWIGPGIMLFFGLIAVIIYLYRYRPTAKKPA